MFPPRYRVADEQEQRRRERAKVSQRAFRVRQAASLRDLRDENARLKSVIKNMVESTRVTTLMLSVAQSNKVLRRLALTARYFIVVIQQQDRPALYFRNISDRFPPGRLLIYTLDHHWIPYRPPSGYKLP